MKKLKSVTAFLLAVSFLTPTVTLFSCTNENIALTPPTQSDELPPEQSTPPIESEPPTPEPAPQPKPEPTPEPEPVIEYAKYVKCTANSVNIRSGAGTGYAVLGSAEKNTTYAVVGQTGNWYKTYYRNQIAYISASYGAVLSLEKSENDQIESVIEQGYKLLGVPYVYGAVRLHDGKGNLLKNFNVQKFDCSSLIQYIFYKGANKILQVNTRTQVKQGKYVAKSDIQRGDCLFFTNEDRQYLSGIEKVGHVALYLGDNYILHTASDYARIEKISAKRWGFYLEARRFI